MSPNTDERGSLDADSYKGEQVSFLRELTDESGKSQAEFQVFA